MAVSVSPSRGSLKEEEGSKKNYLQDLHLCFIHSIPVFSSGIVFHIVDKIFIQTENVCWFPNSSNYPIWVDINGQFNVLAERVVY